MRHQVKNIQLTETEFENLKSQATSSWGGRRKLPYVFTEHGVLMLSSVLNSDLAIKVNIQIMRVYTKIRNMLATHKDLLLKFELFETKLADHDDKIMLIIYKEYSSSFNNFRTNNLKNMKPVLTVFLLLSCVFAALPQESKFIISAPPAELGLDKFYKKYTNASGIPIVSSWRVPDEAIVKVAQMTEFFLNNLPKDVSENLRKHKSRVGILARYEGTTDMPEYAHLESDTTVNWDVRARGLGGSMELPMTSCAEENILCYQIDKYHAEDIFIHEFAHTIHGVGILPTNPEFNDVLQNAIDKAIAEGKWENTYAVTNIWEYWAEGVQSWFNVNGEVPVPDGKHNFVNTREELKSYDPVLYEIVADYFPEVEFELSCHCKK